MEEGDREELRRSLDAWMEFAKAQQGFHEQYAHIYETFADDIEQLKSETISPRVVTRVIEQRLDHAIDRVKQELRDHKRIAPQAPGHNVR